MNIGIWQVVIVVMFFVYSLLCSGCKKFLAVDVPSNQLVTENVFRDKATAIAAVTSIYSGMAYSSPALTDLITLTGLSSDEFTNFYSLNFYNNLYTNALSPIDGSNLPWGSAYKYIYMANSALYGLSLPNNLTESDKNQLIGEALFIRSYWLFYLTGLYGAVPIIQTIDYTKITTIPRSAQSDVYKQIISDLKEAQQLLGSDFMDMNNAATNERTRPSKWAATALLARTYLFSGDYVNAEGQSSMLINNTQKFSLCRSLNDIFLKNSSETIWQIAPSNNTGNTPEGALFILISTPNTISISPQLLKAFEPGDMRRISWIGSITDGGKTYFFPYKYKIKNGANAPTEYSMIFRLSEQYLIRAEARIRLDKIPEGKADLDIIRQRAGLSKTSALSKQDLLTAILHERQTELFSEGHRWLDLKAAGVVNQVMSVVIPQKGGGSWQSYQQLYPIPSSDILVSKNLNQTPGY